MRNTSKSLWLVALAATTLLSGCYGEGGMAYGAPPMERAAGDPYRDGHRGDGYHNRDYQRRYGQYDYNHPDPAYNGYDADRYYRDDSRYRERRLTNEDRVYRGRDNRYYCRRSDGTTGLIVGGLGGAALGSLIAPGDSRGLGAIIGAIGGAAVGGADDSNNVRCR